MVRLVVVGCWFCIFSTCRNRPRKRRGALSDRPPRSSHYLRFVAQTVLVAAAFDSWRFARIERRYRVFGMLKIRHQVVRCAARESLDARILYDRSVELNDHGINECQDPAVVLSRILTRR